MYSLSTSFWIVPASCRRRRRRSPRRPAGTSAAASPPGALIVIDVDSSPSGRPAEERPHVVDRVDRDADLADLAAARSARRSRSPSGSAGRRRRTARRCRWRRARGSARWTPWPCRTRRTAASSTAGRCTCSGRRHACRGTARARPSCSSRVEALEVARVVDRLDRQVGLGSCVGDVGGHAAHDSGAAAAWSPPWPTSPWRSRGTSAGHAASPGWSVAELGAGACPTCRRAAASPR